MSPSKQTVITVPIETVCDKSVKSLVVEREKLLLAVNGNSNLMCALIAKWDLEAQSLIDNGIPSIQRLKPVELREVFTLWQSSGEESAGSFYPQTYLAAGILMALASEKAILALPKGFRTQSAIYPKDKTDLIPYDADPYHLEAIGNAEDITAFISPYSHPNTIMALRQRAIRTVNLGAVQSPEDLKAAIHTVGKTVGAQKKSALLSYFIDAALMAMNNHLKSLSTQVTPNVLYLNYRTFFSAPNQKTLAGNMLKQLDINLTLAKEDSEDWETPLEIEDILSIDPDCLILSTTRSNYILQPPLSNLKALKNQRVYFVDKTIQETPSQHFLLGYFDLYAILVEVTDD